MAEIRFDAPAYHVFRGNESLTRFVRALRRRPYEWALLGKVGSQTMAGTMAYDIARGKYVAFRQGSFEATSKFIFGEFRVYVRFVGDDE
jgi:hypothetical protein